MSRDTKVTNFRRSQPDPARPAPRSTKALDRLLAAIRSREAGARGYDAMYGPAEAKLGPHRLTAMTLAEVVALQRRMAQVSGSSACGGYQFIRRTLEGLMAELDLAAGERFTPELQDRLALHLLRRRGLDRFLAGAISRQQFANNLAKEWASLPVVTKVRGPHRWVEPGETYYAGDGLNKALHTPDEVLALIDAIEAEAEEIRRRVADRGRPRRVSIGGLIAALVAAALTAAAVFFGVR